MAPGEPPRLYTDADGWVPLQIMGHGHRKLRPDRRRLPRGLPDQPGPERAPDAHRRARRSRRTATSRIKRGVDRDPAVHRRRPAAVDCLAPRVRGRQQRRLRRPVRRPRATSRRSPTTRPGTRATSSSASPTGRSSRLPTRPGILNYAPRPRRRTRGPQPGRAARPGRAEPRRSRRALAERRVGRRRPAGLGDGPLARAAAAPAGAEPRRDRRRGSRSRSATRRSDARSPSAAGTSAASSAGSTSGSARPTTCRGPGPVAGRRGRAVAVGHGRPVRRASTRGATDARPWTPPSP